MKTTTTRGRGAAALVAGLALMGGATSVVTTSASAAPDTCDTPYPMTEFDALVDAPVTTSTVTRGTVPESFTGTVLGKIDSGIAPGLDMIMVDFESPSGDTEIDEKGIWAGMSGSPVYAADGRLIGAVAYGLAWGPSAIAGVTPYEEMDDYLGATGPARQVRVDGEAARTIAAESDVTRAQAEQGFRQLPMQLSVSGLGERRLATLKKKGPDYLLTRGMRAAGSAGTADAGPEDLVAGGNLGAAISYGDITAGGVGTVTSVCGDRLVGFGHPMTYGGRTSLGLMPADAIHVQEDLITSFKVANMGAPVGTIDQDRLTGISGTVGPTPSETLVESTVTYGERSRTGSTASLVQDYNASITFSQILANHDRVVDAIQPGSEEATFEITGTDADGAPFTIAFGERYTSSYDIAFEGIWDVADLVWMLSAMDGVTVDDITTTATVTDEESMYRLVGVEQKRRGEWSSVNRRRPVVAPAGGTLRLRALIESVDGSSYVPLSVDVPRKARRGGYLVVAGGESLWEEGIYEAQTPAEIAEAVDGRVRNDQVAAVLHVGRDDETGSRSVSAPQDLVVRGDKFIEVMVRR